MRFPIIPFFLLFFFTSTLAAQWVPTPSGPEFTAQAEAEFSLYAVPLFEPVGQNFTAHQARIQAENRSLRPSPEVSESSSFWQSMSFFIRLRLSGSETTEAEDFLTILLELFENGAPPR